MSAYTRPKPPGLIIAHLQARVRAKPAEKYFAIQRHTIMKFIQEHGISINLWHKRCRGIMPVPTIESLIEAGKVYCVITPSFNCSRSYGGMWPELWQVCIKHHVRLIFINDEDDHRYLGEPNIFNEGYWSFQQAPLNKEDLSAIKMLKIAKAISRDNPKGK